LAKAKEIVLRHKELQAKASKLQAQVCVVLWWFVDFSLGSCWFLAPPPELMYKIWFFVTICN
jgi:hypothetical protein